MSVLGQLLRHVSFWELCDITLAAVYSPKSYLIVTVSSYYCCCCH
jgi:hypothetical protein